MTHSQKQVSPLTIWCFGLGLILLWLAISGQSMNQYLQKEQQQYARRLGKDNALWIMRTGNRLYAATIAKPGIQNFLLERTTPDRKMGEGLAKVIELFQGVVKNFLSLIQQLLYRISVLLACLPFWGVMFIAAIVDGLLIRKIRYHDFHYTSPLQNLWSRRASKWIPGLFLYLIIIPLPVPVLLIPAAAWLTALCLGWWTANWQKKV
ncbi:hypothetical protein GZ78_09575 [Endozoicomonas numazuensis]|uniref:DUF4400 domain-containing protein n=2 Tax=Endozoicomonas numazuensis TaxID=1137799 RepID=A0A081NHF9_9GAMM|nr:hypothetical protein GZ78_09575 [Endozoicomonas numazuensis]